MERVNRIEEKG